MSFDNNDWQKLADDARKLQMLKNSNQQRDALNKMAYGSNKQTYSKAQQKEDLKKFFKIYLYISLGVLVIGGLAIIVVYATKTNY